MSAVFSMVIGEREVQSGTVPFTVLDYVTAIVRKRVRRLRDAGLAPHVRCLADVDDTVQDALLDVLEWSKTADLSQDVAVLKRQFASAACLAAKRSVWKRQPALPQTNAILPDRPAPDAESTTEGQDKREDNVKAALAVINELPERLRMPTVLLGIRGVTPSQLATLMQRTSRCIRLWMREIRQALEARLPRHARMSSIPIEEKTFSRADCAIGRYLPHTPIAGTDLPRCWRKPGRGSLLATLRGLELLRFDSGGFRTVRDIPRGFPRRDDKTMGYKTVQRRLHWQAYAMSEERRMNKWFASKERPDVDAIALVVQACSEA